MASSDLNATSSLTGNEKAGDLSASSSEESCSDEDYTPDSAQSSDTDDDCTTNNNQKRPHSERRRAATESSSSKDASFKESSAMSASSSDESDFDRERIPKKKVPQSKNSSYTTKNYCYVCGKAQTKIARHLLKHKEEEPDIAEVCALPKKSKERKMLLDRLRNRGNFQHNQVVLQYRNGPLKLRRKPTQTNSLPNAKMFVHCVYCKGMYVRKDLWRHMRRCQPKTDLTAGTTSRTKVLVLTAIAEATHSQQISSGVWKMLRNMKQDETAFVLQNDFLILQLAQSLHKKYEEDPTKVHYIRQKLREMGRLLLTLRKKSPVFSFEDAIKPDNFHALVEAVKELAGFDEERHSYRTPTLALKLVNSVKRIGDINLCRALTADNDKVLINEAQTFVKLCAKELTKLVSRNASSTLGESQFKGPSTIPFTRDVQLLYQYLEMKSAKAVESLTKYESPPVYAALAKVTLTQVILFNRQSAGSISKLTLQSFQKRDQTELHEDIPACPSQFLQNVSKVFIRAKILGKGDRTVAVLLTPEVVRALTLLVNKRDTCGVHRDNPLLFARPKPLCGSCYSGQFCIRTFSDECGAENPEYLRSVHLRKHIATLFQILSLENNELDQLAAVLGHDIRADRDFYRLPEATLEIAKISMLLLAKEKGSLARFQGKSLEEIEIEDELEPDDEENDVETRVKEHNEGSDPFLQQQDPSSPEGSSSVVESVTTALSPNRREAGRTAECDKDIADLKNQRGGDEGKAEEERENNSPEETPVRRGDMDMTSSNVEMTNLYISDDDGGAESDPAVEFSQLQESCDNESVANTDLNATPSFTGNEKAEDSSASSPEESCSDEDYIPDSAQNSDSDSDDCFTTINYQRRPHSERCRAATESSSSRNVSFSHRDKAASSSDKSNSGREGIPKKKEPQLKKSSYTKRNYCYVCGKAQAKIARHLFKHKEEESDIAEAFALPKNSKERKMLLEKLRNRGNYQHNQMVLQNNSGPLKLRRKPTRSQNLLNAKMFEHCLYCKGMLSRKDLWRHMRRCHSRTDLNTETTSTTKILAATAIPKSTYLQQISSRVWRMLLNMKQDEIACVIQNDLLVLQLAQSLHSKYEEDPTEFAHIRQKLRELGRLLLTLRNKSIFSCDDAINPNNFCTLIEAVREIAGFDEEKHSYNTPSRALNLVHSLKKIGDINLQRVFAVQNMQVMKESETFVRLCAKELTELLCSTALSLSKSQIKEQSTIPFTRDVQLLCQYLEMKSANAVESLRNYESPQIYAALAKVTLAQVILFNKRSARHISKLTLNSFKKRDQTELHEDTPLRLSQFVQSFSKYFIWTKMLCQDSKAVAVLLTPEVVSALTLLVNKRDKCGVHRDNPLLFARPKRPPTSFYRGKHCVRTFANQCGAQNPKNLRSVHLHKHVTILFQILNLKSDELDELAAFLSHDEGSLEETGDELELDDKEDHADSVDGEHNEGLDPSLQQQDELEPDDKGDDAEKSVEQHTEESDASLQQQDEFEPDDEDDNAENSVYDEHDEESDPSLQQRGPSPSNDSLSVIEPLSTVDTELKNMREGDELEGEKDDSLEEMPTRHDVSEDTNIGMARSNVGTTNTCITEESMDSDTADIDTNEFMDTGEVEQEARMEEEKQKNVRESSNRNTCGPFILSTGMKSTSSALLSRMKELKVLIPKLNIEGLKFPVQASTMCSQTSASSASTTRSRDQSSAAKEIGSVTENSTPAATKKQTTPTLKAPAPQLACSHCKKNLLQGQTAYQRKGSSAIYCSTMCLSATTPLSKPAKKNCYNCFKAILRPQDVILAPVDAKGTMKELCSQTCLSSFNSKWNFSTTKQTCCSMCSKYCVPKCEVILNSSVHKICSSACFVSFGTAKMMSMISCGNCGSYCHSRPLLLRMADGSKTLCSAECLVKFKEKIKTPQPCAMCCSSRAMSDMVEDKNSEDMMELFCSSLCMTAHKLQTVRSSGKNGMKDVEPSEAKLDKERLHAPAQIFETSSCDTVKPPSSPPPLKLKEEPMDETCDQVLPSPASPKDEPNTDKDDFKIGSVCSVMESSTSTATEMQATPSLRDPALPVVCSHCEKSLMDGQTVYQKKGSVDTYCSTTCLAASLPLNKTVTKNCHYCLKAILQPKDAVLALVCAEGTVKDFCSQTCLSSFNHKRNTSSKVPIQPVASLSFCSICTKYCTSKHKVILNGAVHKICSDACFVRFRTVNNLNLISCENCGSHFHSKPLVLNMVGGNKNLCNEECLAKFKEKMNTPHPCTMCRTSQAMSDMVENKNKENVVDLFCNNSCMMTHKIQTVAAQGALLTCDSCAQVTVPTSYLAMSDKSIRNFCTLPCAMAFQEKFKVTSMNVASITPAASTENQMDTSNQSRPDVPKGPVKLPCSHCYQLITAKPHLIHTKDKLVFVCSLSCSLKYKTVNNVISLCEYCKTENVTRDIKRIDNKDCYFCSDNCYLRYKYDLAKSWGKHCPCCAYCFSTSKELVTGQYRGTTEEFCSDDCRSKYNKLFCHTAECDTCGLKRELQQTLPMVGEVKHFCDLNCLLHFCSSKTCAQGQGVNKGTVEATPVIANVISLASALARQPSASASTAQQDTASNIETKVLGHASSPDAVRPPTPPVPKLLKNKAVLCRPLLVDRGVGCETQTVDTQTQTDNFFPKVVVVPLPVPVFVPVPVCMYSQVTPKPLVLPIPLPVPLTLTGKLHGPESPVETVQEKNENIPSDASEAQLAAERAAGRDESGQKKSQKVRVAEKERNRPEPHIPDDQTSNYSDDFNIGDLASFLSNDDDNDAAWLPSPPHGHTKVQTALDVPASAPSELPPPAPPAMDIEADFSVETLEMMAQLREEHQHLPRSATPQRQQAHRKARDKNQGRRSQQSDEAAVDVVPQRDYFNTATLRDPPRLKSQYGLDAWKRWIQWRQTQFETGPASSHPMKLKEDVLQCTTAELSDGLCHFIAEVKRPNGEPYSPDSLFYLCLSIQKHLFENGRAENIFNDASYGEFSTRFTQILKDFKPIVTSGSYVHSRVEEEYLWDCKQLGAYSPIVLLNTLLFFCCKYFGFTTVEQHRQLSFARIMRCTKTSTRNVETKFLRFYPPMSKKKPEAQRQTDADEVPAKKRKVQASKETILEMMENSENPLRCPVRLYEFYLSKCSELAKRRSNLFYLHPVRSCSPNSPLWFSSTPLDDHTMETMLIRILTVRELHVKTGKDGRKRSGRQTANDPLYLPDEEDSE